MTARINAFYSERGYFVANAYLPAQDISDGVVTIVVAEGRYGAIVVNNSSRLSDGIPARHPRRPGNRRADHRRSRSKAACCVVRHSRRAGQIDAGAGYHGRRIRPDHRHRARPLLSGSIDADNAGNRYTGENRFGATLNLNNPLGFGDVAILARDEHLRRPGLRARLVSDAVRQSHGRRRLQLAGVRAGQGVQPICRPTGRPRSPAFS